MKKANSVQSNFILPLFLGFGSIGLALMFNSHVDHPGLVALLSVFFYFTALLFWDPILGVSAHTATILQPASRIEKVTSAGMTTPLRLMLERVQVGRSGTSKSGQFKACVQSSDIRRLA